MSYGIVNHQTTPTKKEKKCLRYKVNFLHMAKKQHQHKGSEWKDFQTIFFYNLWKYHRS